MKSIIDELSGRMATAMAQAGIEGSAHVQPSQDEQFGDYQSNAAMGLAKKAGVKPRELAQRIIDGLSVDDLCEPPELAGPGFINFRLKPAYLAETLQAVPAIGSDGRDRLGLPRAGKPEVVVVDLSSPNLAKEMHVGHLRSTVIGDCVARVLEFQGHTVHRENHVGDWGTQFGMLVAHLRRVRPDIEQRPDQLIIGDLESFYIEAKRRFDADEGFQKESRETVVALQRGDPTVRRIWRAFCDESLRHCHAIYGRLGVKLVDRGESFYNDLMDEVIARVERLRDSGSHPDVRDSEGALCIFLEGFATRQGDPLPLIVRKSDGAYNYATSDIATIVHRLELLKASRIIYVVGISQKQHFEMLFAAMRKIGWVNQHVRLEHLAFGNMLNQAGQPFKTREGKTVKLADLLDEAVSRARAVVESQKEGVDERRRGYAKDEAAEIAESVGLAAIKYFDLQHSLTSDYKFDLETMLSLEGNTAPYMLYAYARIASIGRKAGVDFRSLPADAAVSLDHPSEIALGKKILQFADVIESLARELRPNILTDYLYELSKTFSRFYDKKLGVRVIDASPAQVRLSRLRLCDLTARTLKLGLQLLGIETIERM